MGSVWNRRVTATADGLHLQVDEETTNPNPPGRDDGPNDITVKSSDRPAEINYLANGVTLTDIEMKDGKHKPSHLEVKRVGNGLKITDTGHSGSTYSYYLVGNYRSNTGIRTEDPQIHNVKD